MIAIDYALFLNSFDDFEKIILPLYQKERKAKNQAPLTEDEISNLFLDLIDEYGNDSHPPKKYRK
jgi:hypothetical protein